MSLSSMMLLFRYKFLSSFIKLLEVLSCCFSSIEVPIALNVGKEVLGNWLEFWTPLSLPRGWKIWERICLMDRQTLRVVR